jgi:hypothetical protein
MSKLVKRLMIHPYKMAFVELVETFVKRESAEAGAPLRQAQGSMLLSFVEFVETY